MFHDIDYSQTTNSTDFCPTPALKLNVCFNLESQKELVTAAETIQLLKKNPNKQNPTIHFISLCFC